MTTTINILGIRGRLGPKIWGTPVQFGPDGWAMDMREEVAPWMVVETLGGDGETFGVHEPVRSRIIITSAANPDPAFEGDMMWIHASMSRSDQVPTYEDMQRLHRAVWPQGWAYQLFAPEHEHVNIHENALHLFGRPDGRPELPNFGIHGTI